MTCTENRAKKVGEIIAGIKMLKFNGWEKLLFEELRKIRSTESSFLLRLFFVQGFVRSLTKFMPLIAGLTCFWMYNSSSKVPLTLAKTYSLIAIFNGFTDPIYQGISSFEMLMEGSVSNRRLKRFVMIQPETKNKP